MNRINELITKILFLSKLLVLEEIKGIEKEVLDFLLSEKTGNYTVLRVELSKIDKWHKATIQRKVNNIINWISETLESSIEKAIHQKYKMEITSKTDIPQEFNALAFQRQSVDKGYTLKQGLAAKSNEQMAEALGFNAFSVSLTVSGYKSPLLAILEKNPHIKAVFVESVDRLSRNLGLTLDLLDFCSLNKIQIFVGSNQMNRGIGRATLLLLSVFAEFELTGKQTSYSNDLLNVIKFELDVISFEDMSESEIKLFNNLQFVEIDKVFEKALELSINYKNAYENKVTNKNGNLKANNENLYNNALEIISLLNED